VEWNKNINWIELRKVEISETPGNRTLFEQDNVMS
jgi:hypothetical protein